MESPSEGIVSEAPSPQGSSLTEAAGPSPAKASSMALSPSLSWPELSAVASGVLQGDMHCVRPSSSWPSPAFKCQRCQPRLVERINSRQAPAMGDAIQKK